MRSGFVVVYFIGFFDVGFVENFCLIGIYGFVFDFMVLICGVFAGWCDRGCLGPCIVVLVWWFLVFVNTSCISVGFLGGLIRCCRRWVLHYV